MPDPSVGQLGDSRKAYLIEYTVTNGMEAIVYADSAQEAREKFRRGEIEPGSENNTGRDGRTGGVKVRRWPEEDR